ncbi:hypothetical protein BDC45DRAFT_493031 [Circinella umbellata]|nr:hypothetical protein BDC45DRAFT_528247 [Circinella umbellata]KAI7860880.1 hypothetical protein BDC45DRAFT_493031 [Circinella umbellata]
MVLFFLTFTLCWSLLFFPFLVLLLFFPIRVILTKYPMYSPTQHHFNSEAQQQHEQGFHPASIDIHNNDSGDGPMHGDASPATVGAVPVRSNTATYNTSSSSYSFGAVSLAMSPPSTSGTRGIPFGETNSHNWFGTSMDSVGSSFGQSPPIFNGGPTPIGGRNDLIVSPSTSTSQLDGITTGEEDETQQRNLQEIFEKRRRRRESHNAVERRRRDNINERIHELCLLLPDHLLESAPTSSNVMSVSTSQSGGNIRAINKGTILKLSVDHIKELQLELARYQEKIRELENKIGGSKIEAATTSTTIGKSEMVASYNNTTVSGNDFIDNNRVHQHHPQQRQSQSQPHPASSSSSLLAHHSQQQQQQQDTLGHEAINLVGSSPRDRVNSVQFQQQFGNLHITPDEMARQH